MRSILICDKDDETVETISHYLSGEGYEIYQAYDGEEALKLAWQNNIHLVLMELVLEKLDGISVIQRIREKKSLPIIVLSEKAGEVDKISALNAGADDYITKPCSMSELAARVRSQLRRYIQFQNRSEEIPHIYKVDGLRMDDDSRKVTVDGREVRLTPIEYKILALLMREKGKVYSIEQIYETIWNMRAIGADNTIAVHIRHIREKIEHNPKQPRYLKVVWGTGYKVG
ncbi:MAG: response regulator transcription factor [Lachnospiraceae bacterium]|nr:response regulator transcription factor [Lachnospiraceae bacterium]